jgi:hypothetical protein
MYDPTNEPIFQTGSCQPRNRPMTAAVGLSLNRRVSRALSRRSSGPPGSGQRVQIADSVFLRIVSAPGVRYASQAADRPEDYAERPLRKLLSHSYGRILVEHEGDRAP